MIALEESAFSGVCKVLFRLLYVDDEPNVRELAALALGLDPELEVKTCASGEEALEVAEKWAPDLIMLDYMMPHMDGAATLLRLREKNETAATPIVFVTSRSKPNEIEEMLELGAAAVIAKPFDPMSLASSARQYLRR